MTARIDRKSPGLQGVSGGEYSPPVPYPTTDTELPYIDPAILDHLSKIFVVDVHPSFDIRKYDRMAGQQEVIAYLKRQYEQQQAG